MRHRVAEETAAVGQGHRVAEEAAAVGRGHRVAEETAAAARRGTPELLGPAQQKDLEALFLIHWHIVSMEHGRPMVHIQLATEVPISGTYQCFVLWRHIPEDQSKSEEMIHRYIYMLNYLWPRTHG